VRAPTVAPAADLGPLVFSRDIDDFFVPNGREEEWRFAPIRKLGDFLEPAEWGSVGISGEPDVSVEVVGISDPRLSQTWMPTDRPSVIARAKATHAVLVTIAKESIHSSPIVVDLKNAGVNNYLHVEVHAGAFSKSQVVVIHDTSGNVNGSMLSILDDQADLTMLSVIDAAEDVIQHLHWFTEVGRDANFLGLSITLGGGVIRTVPTLTYRAPGGKAQMLGAFLLTGHQYQEHRILVDHTQPHCVSNVIYKGALSGEGAHSVWIGDVLVRREAVGIETYELNRNLLLTDGPRADSVPNLELETGDVVSAGHASATGRFDDEQLFYLQSRGIPESIARQLVVRGFFVDVLSKIDDTELRGSLMRRIESQLGMADGGS
jgi:Fe-S cluster assembly protein SufD